MLIGLLAIGSVLPFLSFSRGFGSAVALYVAPAVSVSLVVTPSLAFMAKAISAAGVQSFGVAYGIYNFAWALGLLAGPAAGGFLYERMGFARLTAHMGPRRHRDDADARAENGVQRVNDGGADLPFPPLPAICSIRLHSASVIGITDNREILTSGQV